MPYNPAYYCDQVARCGLAPVKDLQSWTLTDELARVVAETGPARERLRETVPVTCRSLDPTRFAEEVEAVRELCNTAFVRFWGFTPVSQEEFLELATGYRPLLDPDLVVLAERNGRTVGCLMALPDVSQALARAGGWRSIPARAVATLWHWKGPGRRRTVSRVRVDMVMVHPPMASRQLGRLLILELLRRVDDRRYTAVEAGPVLEGSGWLRCGVAQQDGRQVRWPTASRNTRRTSLGSFDR